jgi:hypothetical protein
MSNHLWLAFWILSGVFQFTQGRRWLSMTCFGVAIQTTGKYFAEPVDLTLTVIGLVVVLVGMWRSYPWWKAPEGSGRGGDA